MRLSRCGQRQPVPWLDDLGPWLTLLIPVGDATDTLDQTVSHATEDTQRYLVYL